MKTIRHALDATKRQIRLLEGGTAGLVLVTFALAFLAAEIILDRLFLLDRSFRSAALVTFAGLGGAVAVVGLVLAGRRITDPYAARALERAHPSLRESLITFVQLERGEALGSETVRRTLEASLARELPSMSLVRVVHGRLKRLLGAFGALAAALALGVAVVTGGGFATHFRRVVAPSAGLAPATETRIVDVRPGDHMTLVGSEVPVSAACVGRGPAEVTLYLAYEEGVWYRVPMRHAADRWEAVVPPSESSFRYFVAAGDTRTDVYRATVLPPPVLEELSATVEWPSYTRRPAKTVPGGDLEVLPGSFVTLRGRPNRALASAELVMDAGERVPFRLFGEERAAAGFGPKTGGGYRLELVDSHGLRHPNPPRFRLEVRPDRPPEVRILSPAQTGEIGADQPIDLRLEASDDHGLAHLELVSRVRGGGELRRALPIGELKDGRMEARLAASDLALKPGGSVLYYLEARDLATRPNAARSAIHVLHQRRGPLEELQAYKDVERSLDELAADRDALSRMGLEEAAREFAPEKGGEQDKLIDKLRELLERQDRLAREAEALAEKANPDLHRLREELQELMKELQRAEADTRDLPSRGVNRQERMLDQLASRLRRQGNRAEALRKQLEERAKERDASRSLQQAAKKLEEAAKRLKAAAKSMESRATAQSSAYQAGAGQDLEQTLRALDEALGAAQTPEDRLSADELARLQKELRELTRDLLDEADPDAAKRLEEAMRAMKEAQSAFEQGNPSAAEEAAGEAGERLEEAVREEGAPQEPVREPDAERRRALAAILEKLLEDHEGVRRGTAEADRERASGRLTLKQLEGISELGRREHGLSERVVDVLRELKNEPADVYRWALGEVRSGLLEAGDLLVLSRRTDGYVRHLQEEISRRLGELIEALKPAASGGGGGGGGGGGAGSQPRSGSGGRPSSGQGSAPSSGSASGNNPGGEQAGPGSGAGGDAKRGPAAPAKESSSGLPRSLERAEKVARELLDRLAKGQIDASALARHGLSADRLKAFLQGVERARAKLAASRDDGSSAPPTFADFLEEVDRTRVAGREGETGGTAGTSKGEGRGELRGVTEGMKEALDLEYRDLLEEYYRSLADPIWKKR